MYSGMLNFKYFNEYENESQLLFLYLGSHTKIESDQSVDS